ncbi:unnamed protein product [Clonostachys byssicola]|uniref:Uncharacterized protein n=1 Tax=Clonostachys byssicola TaxID=160290 RepID=A0A9N9US63_9HYPO|nr:unnamed protein product [Clonostachys byssicola]
MAVSTLDKPDIILGQMTNRGQNCGSVWKGFKVDYSLEEDDYCRANDWLCILRHQELVAC